MRKGGLLAATAVGVAALAGGVWLISAAAAAEDAPPSYYTTPVDLDVSAFEAGEGRFDWYDGVPVPTAERESTEPESITVNDGSGSLSVVIPAVWSDVDDSLADGALLASLSAAADLQLYKTTFAESGMSLVVIARADSGGAATWLYEFLAATRYAEVCTVGETAPLRRPGLDGVIIELHDCANTSDDVVLAAADGTTSDGVEYTATIVVQADLETDQPVVDEILATFWVSDLAVGDQNAMDG